MYIFISVFDEIFILSLCNKEGNGVIFVTFSLSKTSKKQLKLIYTHLLNNKSVC